jgi:hypothetical protein
MSVVKINRTESGAVKFEIDGRVSFLTLQANILVKRLDHTQAGSEIVKICTPDQSLKYVFGKTEITEVNGSPAPTDMDDLLEKIATEVITVAPTV